MRRIGIYAGSFDPIHDGHLSFALRAHQDLQLDFVVFAPEKYPRRKSGITSLQKRAKNIQAITDIFEQFDLIVPDKDNFSVSEALRDIRSRYPDSELVFLFGSDVVLGMKHWPDIAALLSHKIVVGLRHQHTERQIIEIFNSMCSAFKLDISYTIIKTTQSHMSSSVIRKQ